jgi:kumamolisin
MEIPDKTTWGAAGCTDIIEADNISPAVSGYSAGTGYDAVTRWASPPGTAFLRALQPLV